MALPSIQISHQRCFLYHVHRPNCTDLCFNIFSRPLSLIELFIFDLVFLRTLYSTDELRTFNSAVFKTVRECVRGGAVLQEPVSLSDSHSLVSPSVGSRFITLNISGLDSRTNPSAAKQSHRTKVHCQKRIKLPETRNERLLDGLCRPQVCVSQPEAPRGSFSRDT